MVRVPRPAARWPAIARLIRHTDRRLIGYHADGAWWSAEQVTGTAVRFLAAYSLDELAERIGRAEARL